MTTIPEKYNNIIKILRDTLIECGGRPLYKAEDFGLNTYHPSTGKVELVFDYDAVHELITPEGTIQPYGSHVTASDSKQFFNLLQERLGLVELLPQRDDNKTDYLRYQLAPSGGVYEIAKL